MSDAGVPCSAFVRERCHDFGSQAKQGVGWMPRGQEPKKGAESGETWMGSCKRAKSHPDPNGATCHPSWDGGAF